MEELVDRLQKFGLTDNEARAYVAFLCHGPMNGYEVAKKSAIARGNIYTCLNRLLEKGAITAANDEKFIAVPLDIYIGHYEAQLKQAGRSALALIAQHRQHQEEAQVMSVSGTEAVLNCCRTILQAKGPSTYFIAAFPQDLEALESEIKQTKAAGANLSILCFGKKPQWLPEASEHLASHQIESAQGGRLLIAAGFPNAIVAVIQSESAASGIWAWNRYLASAAGLYVSHEILIMKMWPLIPKKNQNKILETLTDISSRIALAGVVEGLPLHDYVSGAVTPKKGK